VIPAARRACPETISSVADAGAVYATGADARDDHAEIIAVERGRLGVDRPSDAAEDAADEDDEARAVLSTNHPSTGTSQVSNSTKRVKAHWIEARSHRISSGCLGRRMSNHMVIGDHHHREDADGNCVQR